MSSDGFLFVNAGNTLPLGYRSPDSTSRAFHMVDKTRKLAGRRKEAMLISLGRLLVYKRKKRDGPAYCTPSRSSPGERVDHEE
jgi:hypothetical protein